MENKRFFLSLKLIINVNFVNNEVKKTKIFRLTNL